MTTIKKPVSGSFKRVLTVLSKYRLAFSLSFSETVSNGFVGSSMTIISAPDPVKLPPTEVALRDPVQQVRRQQQRLISVDGYESCTHRASIPERATNVNSYLLQYSQFQSPTNC